MPDSGPINVLAIHATANTAPPAAPNKGSNVPNTGAGSWDTAGFEMFGSTQLKSHDYDLETDKITGALATEMLKVRPPRALSNQAVVLLSQILEEVEFRAWGMVETMYALASNLSQGSNKTTAAGTLTPRTVAIEIDGLAMIHMPNVYVLMSTPFDAGYGDDGVNTVGFTLDAAEGDSLAAGWEIIHYQPAA